MTVLRQISIPGLRPLLVGASTLALVAPAAASAAPAAKPNARTADRAPAGAHPLLAARTAVRAVRGSRLFELDLTRSRGATFWKAEVSRRGGAQWKLRISLDGRHVRSIRRDRDRDREARLVHKARIPAARAIKVAQRRTKARLTDLDFERRRGGLRWEAELATRSGVEFDVVINARTGKVVSVRRDD